MPCLHSYMLTLFSNRSSRHTIQKPSRLWVFAVKNRAAPRRERASWHPSKISLIFRTFAKTDLGILQENPNVLLDLSWRSSKPRNIHAPLLAPVPPTNALTPCPLLQIQRRPAPNSTHYFPDLLSCTATAAGRPVIVLPSLILARCRGNRRKHPGHLVATDYMVC